MLEIHLYRRLDRFGAAAISWKDFIVSDRKNTGEFIVAIGRTLRGQLTTTEARQHANVVLYDWFGNENGVHAARATFARLREQCMLGLKAAKNGDYEEETLLNLLTSRDDLESLYVAAQTAKRFAEADLAYVPDFTSFAEDVEAVIKQTDSLVDFEIPRNALSAASDSLCSRDKAHLCALANGHANAWWLAPLVLLAIGDKYKKRVKKLSETEILMGERR